MLILNEPGDNLTLLCDSDGRSLNVYRFEAHAHNELEVAKDKRAIKRSESSGELWFAEYTLGELVSV